MGKSVFEATEKAKFGSQEGAEGSPGDGDKAGAPKIEEEAGARAPSADFASYRDRLTPEDGDGARSDLF